MAREPQLQMSASDSIAQEVGSKGQIPLLDYALGIVFALPGLAVRGTNALLEGATEIGNITMSFAKSSVAMGSSLFSGPSGPEISPVRAPEISAPAPAMSLGQGQGIHICDSEIGCLSPSGGGSSGIGGHGFGR